MILFQLAGRCYQIAVVTIGEPESLPRRRALLLGGGEEGALVPRLLQRVSRMVHADKDDWAFRIRALDLPAFGFRCCRPTRSSSTKWTWLQLSRLRIADSFAHPLAPSSFGLSASVTSASCSASSQDLPRPTTR